MNKKTIIGIVAVVLVIVIAVVAVILIKGRAVTIDLQALNTEISEKSPFDEMPTQDIDKEVLESQYEIKDDQYEEFIGKMPLMNIQASMYLVIKAKDDTVDSVKEKVETYAQKQEDIWSTYLPEQYELVKNRKLGVKGNYVYLIISESSTELEELITK